ncbi:hypothetical protein FRC09_016806 [Ceratobasidium sp. 395]|nr:hypothetical protein FRC09_016806 [Ceratobasidium sp. 395]
MPRFRSSRTILDATLAGFVFLTQINVLLSRFCFVTLRDLVEKNPSGAPPYYVTSKPCPAPADIATKAFTAFNFVGYQNDEINYQWYGATIPSKKKYQGPEPGATNCQGSYSVNATGPAGQHNYPGLGEPSTLRGEDYRVHLYCPKGKGGKYVSAFNNFILVNQ